jgi:hypothetical protein
MKKKLKKAKANQKKSLLLLFKRLALHWMITPYSRHSLHLLSLHPSGAHCKTHLPISSLITLPFACMKKN